MFLATLAVWMLVVCAGAGTAAGALQQLGENGAFVSSLLAAELGGARGGGLWEGLDGWGRLVVDQSPLLQANHGGARPEGDGEKPGPALDLPAGEHEVELRYTPPGLLPGLALGALSLAGLALAMVKKRKRR